MTDQHVATAVERMLGEHATYIHDDVTNAIADRIARHDAARAVVVNFEDMRTRAWGVHRRFATVASVEVYA